MNLLETEIVKASTVRISRPANIVPTTVDYIINGACNLNCFWCWGPDHNVKEELTIEQWKELSYHLHLLGTCNITITGGEPLLKKDLLGILKYLHEDLHIRVTLSSNGLFLKSMAHEILPYVDDIGLPLDGHSTEMTYMMRALSSKQFEDVLKTIHFVQNEFSYIDLTVRTVVSKLNAQSVPQIGRTMIDYGIDPSHLRWKLYQITPIGSHKQDIINRQWILSDEEFNYVIDEVIKQNPRFTHISFLSFAMHHGRYFHIYPDGESHVIIMGKDGLPTYSSIGNIRKNFDHVINKLKEFDFTNNMIRSGKINKQGSPFKFSY